MDDRERVTRFMAFILTPPELYPGGDFDSFLADAMAHMLLRWSEPACQTKGSADLKMSAASSPAI
jgi:hypothetical protein